MGSRLSIGPDQLMRAAPRSASATGSSPFAREAHALPFASAFFDAIVSVDAYQYFGTDILYPRSRRDF